MKKILIVDDDPKNLEILRGILAPEGYQLSFATNGRKAIHAAEKHKPDLILMDVMMPEMDGYEACEIIKKIDGLNLIPVIFVTAIKEEENEAKGFDLGGVDYIRKPISPTIVVRRIKAHLSLVRVSILNDLISESIRMLGEAGHYNDNDTGEHIWRISEYSTIIARCMKLDVDDLENLSLAAPLHDTGKIGIPDQILKAPRKLTLQEWEIMKTHSEIGMKILSKSDNPVFQLASTISFEHHEKWDSSGYPRGLKGNEISIQARIVAIADVFDALTNRRPYKEPWSIEDTVSEIKRLSGKHFDPYCVEVFLSQKEVFKEILIMNRMKSTIDPLVKKDNTPL